MQRFFRAAGHEKILTPHVGELARLLHMTIAECQRDPAESAGRAAEKYQACCVRKDSVTVTQRKGVSSIT